MKLKTEPYYRSENGGLYEDQAICAGTSRAEVLRKAAEDLADGMGYSQNHALVNFMKMWQRMAASLALASEYDAIAEGRVPQVMGRDSIAERVEEILQGEKHNEEGLKRELQGWLEELRTEEEPAEVAPDAAAPKMTPSG